MRTAREITLVGLTVLLLVALAGYIFTRETADSRLLASSAKTEPVQPKLVDQEPLETAHNLADVSSTADEEKLAEGAIRIADHEVDLAFASALQSAQLHPPVQNATTREINARIQLLQGRLQSVQSAVARLSSNPHRNDNEGVQQQLETAQAQLALLQDALEDSKEDLVRAGGDPQAEIKLELEEHEALAHGNAATSYRSSSKPAIFAVPASLVEQFREWRRLRTNRQRLLQARQQAETYAVELTRKHEAMEKGMPDLLSSDAEIPAGADTASVIDKAQHAARMSRMQSLSSSSKLMAQYDKRIQAEQQLSALYGRWINTLDDQIRSTLHAVMRSVLLILLALLVLVLIEGFLERFYIAMGPERRRLGTMRLVFRFVSQLLGVLVILLVLFGPPRQLSTVLALGAAGLTVALKDFIVAFFGWFVLMGRHGIRAGDWVEINGIGGEVVEVGLLHTIILETGNWNDAGHPTGRKVSFVNSYAVEGHYFNFTTAGQWLWDELDVLIPAGEDPYYLINSVLKLVTEQTQADAAEAEQEWRRATQRSAIQTFSATPAIDVRPTNLGVNLVVRYVVNAHNRYEVRTRLYQSIVELLHAGRSAPPEPSQVPAARG